MRIVPFRFASVIVNDELKTVKVSCKRLAEGGSAADADNNPVTLPTVALSCDIC